MRRIKAVTLGEITVTVKELTVAEIRAWLKDLEAVEQAVDQADVIGWSLFEDVTLADLLWMSDLTHAAADALLPSELQLVIAEAKELNADFFGLRARLVHVAKAAALPRA